MSTKIAKSKKSSTLETSTKDQKGKDQKGKIEMASITTASNYKHYRDQKEHVLMVPGMYVGSVKQIPYQGRLLVFDEEGPKEITEVEISVPQAVERLALEIISNTGDNADRSRKAGVDVGQVDIVMNETTISVTNGGMPVPIEIHEEHKMWVPELIFGTLLSGSNYETERTGAGVNGLGAKLTNIFSTYFRVDVGDPYRRLKYTQEWRNHMYDRSDPIIEQEYDGPSFVTITYTLDFDYFGYTEGQYPAEAFYLFAMHAADLSFNSKLPVTFNGMNFDFQDISNYARLYFGDKVENSIIHYEYPEGAEIKGKKKSKNLVPVLELCLIDTPDEATCISFVNGMLTREGGVHVTAVHKTVSTAVLQVVNGEKSGKKKDKDEKKKVSLTMKDVTPHISMILSCRLVNPEFVGQTKDSLRSPAPKISIPDRTINDILNWNLINRLYAELEAKQYKNSSKTDGKKKLYINLEKGEDANEAGGPLSGQCTLLVTEGKSAMGYGVKAVALDENGRDFNGLYPMKGKPLNVMNARYDQIHENSEITDLKKMLGLRERVDYTIKTNFDTLRYGKLLIMADADDDGKHIIGLILNMFHVLYPSLLAIGYVMYLRTPIMHVYDGKTRYKFYTEREYEVWRDQVDTRLRNLKPKYLKGLGSSKDSDIEDDFSSPRKVVCLYDDSAPDMFRLAFDDKLADERKEWLAQHKPLLELDSLEMQPISQFLYYEFVEFSLTNVARSIPRLLDGLKISQRKAIWGAILKWGAKTGDKRWKDDVMRGNIDEYKVAQFGGFISGETAYKHGEKCMQETVISMAQSFIGANNLPYFTEDGQFGTRNMNGEDAADPRYIFTRPRWWLPYVLKNDDMPLLTHVVEEGDVQEPLTFLPIIPLALVNGCSGIGTGHSTRIPPYNPTDICNWIKCRVTGEQLPEILPWFRGFTGTIQVVHRHIKSSTTESTVDTQPEVPDDPSDDTLDPDHEGEVTLEKEKMSLITTGLFRLDVNNKGEEVVIVTELPIGRSIHKYDSWLEKLVHNKIITNKINRSTDNSVYFEITGLKNPSTKTLRLQKSFGLSNMVFLDNNNKPIKYDTVADILEEFCTQRLPYYEVRRRHIIDNIQSEIDRHDIKARFIRAILDHQIEIFDGQTGRPIKKSVILTQMHQLGFPSELLSSTTLTHLSEDDITSLLDKINTLTQERIVYEQTPPTDLWIKDIDEFMAEYNRHYDPNAKHVPVVRAVSASTTKRKKTQGKSQSKAKRQPRKAKK